GLRKILCTGSRAQRVWPTAPCEVSTAALQSRLYSRALEMLCVFLDEASILTATTCGTMITIRSSTVCDQIVGVMGRCRMGFFTLELGLVPALPGDADEYCRSHRST